MIRLILVRHGQSTWNLENKFTGWVDVDLSARGIEEAHSAGKRLKNVAFSPDIAFTSKLMRAQKTLRIILEELGAPDTPTTENEALNERHYGDLQGKNKAETAQEFGEEQVRIWRRSYDTPPPNGESLKDTAARAIPYFEKFIQPLLLEGKHVIVVAHGNSLRSIAMKLDNLTEEEVLNLEIPTGQPLLYEFAGNSYRRIGYV